jgi:hypothetical protein
MSRSRAWRGTVLVAAGLAAVIGVAPGCGSADGLNRQPVSGTVKIDGVPLAKGVVLFFPIDDSKVSVFATGNIKDGRFAIKSSKGPVPGIYTVSFSSMREVPLDEEGREPGTPLFQEVETIPEKFNTKTKLKVEINDGGVKFGFDLKTNP